MSAVVIVSRNGDPMQVEGCLIYFVWLLLLITQINGS